MGISGVPELNDERMPIECPLYEAALDTATPTVDEAYFSVAGLVRRAQVVIHHGYDVPWVEGVQIDRVVDGETVDHAAV